MLKKLRIKYILVSMLSIMVVTSTLYAIIAWQNYLNITRQLDFEAETIAENGGSFPSYSPNGQNSSYTHLITPETKYSTRYFTVMFENGIPTVNIEHIASIDEDSAIEMVDKILNYKRKTGYYQNYRYLISTYNGNQIIVCVNATMQLGNFKSFVKKSIITMVIGFAVIILIVTIWSGKIIKPISENIEKQKQFIENAGHDLKTPIAVIKANVEVLEMTSNGEKNEWVESIKNQANKMEVLVKNLLSLSLMEEKEVEYNFVNLSLDKIVSEEVTAFEALAKNNEIKLKTKGNINVEADENSIRQLIGILMDNAIKYSSQNEPIEVNVYKKNGKPTIEVINKCDNYDEINTDRLFDRFYRGDQSRNNKKQGYGIGLSMAKSIAAANKAEIKAKKIKDNKILFIVTF